MNLSQLSGWRRRAPSFARRCVATAGLCLMALGGGAASAQEAAPYARAVKMDAEKGMFLYYKIVEFQATFDAEMNASIAERDRLDDEMRSLQQNLHAGALIMSEATRASIVQQLENKQIQMRRYQDDTTRKMEGMRNDAMSNAEAVMHVEARAEAEARMADLIILVDGRNPSMIAVGSRLPDITEATAARMNAPCKVDAACRAKHHGLPGID